MIFENFCTISLCKLKYLSKVWVGVGECDHSVTFNTIPVYIVTGTCRCNAGFTGFDCSRTTQNTLIVIGPEITMCDTRGSSCEFAPVIGYGFTPGNVTCYVQQNEVREIKFYLFQLTSLCQVVDLEFPRRRAPSPKVGAPTYCIIWPIFFPKAAWK